MIYDISNDKFWTFKKMEHKLCYTIVCMWKIRLFHEIFNVFCVLIVNFWSRRRLWELFKYLKRSCNFNLLFNKIQNLQNDISDLFAAWFEFFSRMQRGKYSARYKKNHARKRSRRIHSKVVTTLIYIYYIINDNSLNI